MAKKVGRYEGAESLSAETALLAAANMLIDAGDLAYTKGDTDTLLETGDRLTRLGAILMHGPELQDDDTTSETDRAEGDEGGSKVKMGFS